MAGCCRPVRGPGHCLVIENYEYRPCPRPEREFRSAVSLHNHSSYSTENLASLNEVMRLWFMRPIGGLVQRSFGLNGVKDLDYADMLYHPLAAPEQVFRLERESAQRVGLEHAAVAITDHDEIAGSLALADALPAEGGRIGLGEELSLRFEGYVFHLGVTGLGRESAPAMHARLQAASRAGCLDEVFERLKASGCLVVLNHPLLPWRERDDGRVPAVGLLKRYGWAIDALEYNGMRRKEENAGVIELARHVSKPLVGGGDSHLLAASSVLCATDGGGTFREFVEEVKSGRGVPLIKPDYFAPLGWKMFLRVFTFIANYRKIGIFRGQPVARMLERRRVLLDPVGWAARLFLRATAAAGLIR